MACVKNPNNVPVNVNFNLKYGVAAKDYSEVAKAKDLKPIELDVNFLIINS